MKMKTKRLQDTRRRFRAAPNTVTGIKKKLWRGDEKTRIVRSAEALTVPELVMPIRLKVQGWRLFQKEESQHSTVVRSRWESENWRSYMRTYKESYGELMTLGAEELCVVIWAHKEITPQNQLLKRSMIACMRQLWSRVCPKGVLGSVQENQVYSNEPTESWLSL